MASDENQSPHQKRLGLDVSHISVVLNFAHAIILHEQMQHDGPLHMQQCLVLFLVYVTGSDI